MNHFRTAAASGKTLTMDSKSSDRLQAERDMLGRPKVPKHEQSAFSTLQRQMAESNLDRVALQKQGGPRAVAQKERATAMLNQQNEHGGRK